MHSCVRRRRRRQSWWWCCCLVWLCCEFRVRPMWLFIAICCYRCDYMYTYLNMGLIFGWLWEEAWLSQLFTLRYNVCVCVSCMPCVEWKQQIPHAHVPQARESAASAVVVANNMSSCAAMVKLVRAHRRVMSIVFWCGEWRRRIDVGLQFVLCNNCCVCTRSRTSNNNMMHSL